MAEVYSWGVIPDISSNPDWKTNHGYDFCGDNSTVTNVTECTDSSFDGNKFYSHFEEHC